MQQRHTLIICCLALFLTTIEPHSLYAWTGKVVGITDGDTITVLRDRAEVKIRLHGIDTPEKKQPFGQAAKKATAQLTAGKIVDVDETDTDKYGRTVAIVTADSVNVNRTLVKNGYAWVYRKYCKQDFCNDWLDLEEKAKTARLGLWRDTNPEPPWDWRAEGKGHTTITMGL